MSESRLTGRTRLATFTVWSLDVWGHSPSECHKYGCPCMKDDDGEPMPAADPDTLAHDDFACQCDYTVNDRCRVGTVTIEEIETEWNVGTEHAFTSYSAEDSAFIAALIEDGFLKPNAGELVDFDDGMASEDDLWLYAKETGEPLFQLERETDRG